MTAENTLLFKTKSELQNEIAELLEIEAQFIEQQKLIITKKRTNLAAAIKNLSAYEKILEDAGEILKEESEILKNEEKLNKSDKDDLAKKSENQEKEEENIEASEKVTEKEKELIDKKGASIKRALKDVKERLKLDEKTQELIERYNELHDSFTDNVKEAEAELKLRIYGSVKEGEKILEGGLLANLFASMKDPTHAAKVGQRVRDRLARPWKMAGAVMQGTMAAPGFAARAIGGFFGFGLKKPKDDLAAATSTESKKNKEESNNTIQFKKPGEKNGDASSGEVLSKSEIIESRQDTQAFREKVLYYLSIISQTAAATAKKSAGQGVGDENQSGSGNGSLWDTIANIAIASQLIPKKLKGLWTSFKRFFKKTNIKLLRFGRYLKGLPGAIKLAAGIGTAATAASIAASANAAAASVQSINATASAAAKAAQVANASAQAVNTAAKPAAAVASAAKPAVVAAKIGSKSLGAATAAAGVLIDGTIGYNSANERFGEDTTGAKLASMGGEIAGGGPGIGEGSTGEVAANIGLKALEFGTIGAIAAGPPGAAVGAAIGAGAGAIGGDRIAEASKPFTDWATGDLEARQKRNAEERRRKKIENEEAGIKDQATLEREQSEQEKLNKLNKFKGIHKSPAELDKTKSDVNKNLTSLDAKNAQVEKITKKSAEKPAVKPSLPPAKQNDKKTKAGESSAKSAQKLTTAAKATKKSTPVAVTKPSAKKTQPSKSAKITSKDFSAADLAKFDKFITGNEKEGLGIAEYIDKYGAEKFMHSFTNKLSDEEMNKHFGLNNAKEQEFNKQAAKFGGPTVAQRRMMELSQQTGFTKKVYDIKKKKQNLVSTSPSKPSAPVNKSAKSAPKAPVSNSSTNNGTKEIVKAINSQKSVAFVQQSKANYVTGTALPVNG